jgi:hypothetical protein
MAYGTAWPDGLEVVLTAGGHDPSASFRLDGRPFTSREWSVIEQSPRVLSQGTRATAWVCADGQVLVDWNAPSEQA